MRILVVPDSGSDDPQYHWVPMNNNGNNNLSVPKNNTTDKYLQIWDITDKNGPAFIDPDDVEEVVLENDNDNVPMGNDANGNNDAVMDTNDCQQEDKKHHLDTLYLMLLIWSGGKKNLVPENWILERASGFDRNFYVKQTGVSQTKFFGRASGLD